MSQNAAMPSARIALILILVLGFALRIVASEPARRPLVSDERDYYALGATLARTGAYEEHGRPTAYRAPGYPAFLAGVQLLAADSGPRGVRLVQAALDAASAGLLYALAAPSGPFVALAAAVIWSVYPPAIVYTRLLLPESLFVFLLLLWLLLAARLSWNRWWAASCLGAGAGGLALVKTEAVLLLAIVPIVAWLRGIRAWAAALFLLAGALALTPWIARNARVLGEPVLVTSTGPVFLIGNHPRATGGYAPDVPDSMLPRSTGEAALARESTQNALRYIAGHPVRFLTLGCAKIALVLASEVELAVTAFHPAPSDHSTPFRRKALALPPWIPLGLSLAYAALLLAGCLGHLAMPDDRIAWLSASILAAWLAAHFLTFGGSRYHQVLMPLAALGAARVAAMPREVLAGLVGWRRAAFLAIVVALAIVWSMELRALLRP